MRSHSHEGASKPHPVSKAHKSASTRVSHDRELREHGRNLVRKSWEKPAKPGDLKKLQPYKRPSTMDKHTHAHFEKIVGGLIKDHQKKYNVKSGYVRKEFHAVEMPSAYRKLKETHHQKTTGGKWHKT